MLKLLQKLIFSFTFILCLQLGSNLQAAIHPRVPDETIPRFDLFLLKKGITENYSEESKKNLLAFTKELIEKNPESWGKKELAFLKYSQEELLQKKNQLLAQERKNHSVAQEIIYMLYANQAVDLKNKTEKPLLKKVERRFQIALRFFNKRRLLRVNHSRAHLPVGELQASKEADQLVDPAAQDSSANTRVLTKKELAKLTPRQIGQLDILPTHPMWHTKSHMKQRKIDIWDENENTLNQLATKFLQKEYPEYQTTTQSSPFSYDLTKAHKIVFFDELKDTGTNPKIDVKDPYGFKWKMKWGAEVHPEVISNRLYTALGGKFVDPVYVTEFGGKGVTLILNKAKEGASPAATTATSASASPSSQIEQDDLVEPDTEDQTEEETNNPNNVEDIEKFADLVKNADEQLNANANANESGDEAQEEKKEKCSPVTPQDFINCLKKSKYRFNLKTYIQSSGLITKENLKEILQYMPASPLKKNKPEELIGRYYITFKEAQVEFSSQDVINRGGPISWTRFSSKSDRVKRALLLFNSWINNIDAKEDNNKDYLIKNPQDGSENLVMAQHDLGNSITGLIGAGNLNEFSTTNFILHGQSSLFFNFFMIYLPGAWPKSTYADLYWMAEKIVQLKREQVEKIVSFTLWPDFMQKAAVYKILMRRNRIADLFKITNLLDEKTITPPSQSIPLKTLEDRKKAAEKYHLDFTSLEKDFQNSKLAKDKNAEDNILKNGRVSLCQTTFLMRRMHLESYPTGLDRRLVNQPILGKIPGANRCGGIVRVNLSWLLDRI